MQTFLPYPDFWASADVLDDLRLRSQIREASQLLKACLADQDARREAGRRYGRFYRNHPALLMWKGCPGGLAMYLIAMHDEYRKRGGEKFIMARRLAGLCVDGSEPWWLGREALHSSHRARLLGKNPEWYGQFGWTEQPALDNSAYWWPVQKGESS